MGEGHQKPGMAFWATVVGVGLVLYPLSVGPACRFLTLVGDPDWAVEAYTLFYTPIWWVYDNGPEPVHRAIWWYCRSLW